MFREIWQSQILRVKLTQNSNIVIGMEHPIILGLAVIAVDPVTPMIDIALMDLVSSTPGNEMQHKLEAMDDSDIQEEINRKERSDIDNKNDTDILWAACSKCYKKVESGK